MKTKTRFHKLTAWLLTLAMLMTFIPSFTLSAFAADNLCEHHTEHTAECGYVEGVSECTYACEESHEEEPSEEPAPVCDCGTDDPAIHAVSCAVYVAPENPQCFCVEKCTAENFNEYCDVCGFDYSKCGGADTASAYDLAQDENGVYLIATVDELYAFAVLVNGGNVSINGKLTANIEVNQGTMTAASTNVRAWTPIGNNSNRYAGTFDGADYTISGLYVNDNSADYIGLFGYVGTGGTVQNVGVINSYISGKSYIGGVAGLNQSNVMNCYNTGAVSGDSNVGGVVGLNRESNSIVMNCYNTGAVTGDSNVGGVVGFNRVSGSTITNCYNIGAVTGNTNTGSVLGYLANDGHVTNCYYLSGTAKNDWDIGYPEKARTAAVVKNATQFASGEVAYLLQQGCTVGEGDGAATYSGDAWGQDLDNGKPSQTAPTFNGAKVYRYYVFSADDAEWGYTNDPNVTTEKPSSYTVTIAETSNGTVNVGRTTASEGDTVTLTITPAEGYELDTLTVKDADNNDITVTDNKFTMPATDVTVTATFKAVTAAETHSHDMSVACGNDDPMTFNAWDGTTAFPGGNVYLTDNVTLTESLIISSGTVNLCLNGHTITITNSQDAFYVESGATLNICDCSTNQSGKIEKTSASADYPGILNRGGTVNVYSGTVSSSNNSNGIYNYSGTVNVYSGTVSSSQRYGINNKGTVNVYGGTVSGIYSGINNKGTVNVYGGTVSSSYSYGIYNDANLNIYGGTVSGISSGINNGADGEITVSGGTVTSEGDAGTGIYNYGEVTVSGGTVKSTGADGNNYGIYCNTGTLNLSGAPTITGTAAGVYLLDGGSITLGGELSYTQGNAISVLMETPGTFTTGWTDKMGENAENYGSYFTSKNEGYTVQPDGRGELKLAERPSSYTVTFNANGGSGTMANQTIEVGTETALSPTSFTRSGYKFSGWATSADGAKVYDDKQSVTDIAAAGESITLFAVWTEKATITISDVQQQYDYTGEPIEFNLNSPLTGFTVKYRVKDTTTWSDSIPTEVNIYDVKITRAEDADYKAYEMTFFGKLVINKALQSAPAAPAVVNETIKNKKDGKITGVTSDMEYKKQGDADYTEISGTSLEGLEADTYLVRYKETETHSAGADKELVIADGKTISAAFDMGGHGTSVDPQSGKAYGDTVTEPAAPADNEWKFIGWYKENTFTDEWDFVNDTLSDDTTIYAKWEEKKSVAIDEDAQTYYYDGSEKGFVLSGTDAGLTGFDIQYKIDGTYGSTKPTEFGSYDVKITREYDNEYKAYSKEITRGLVIAQSGTEFTDKQILKDGTPTTTFTYGDTITVKIKPQATGQAAPMMLMSLSAPAKNQMALFYNNGTEDIQISDVAEADSDGYYTMTVNTTENLVMPTNATVSLIAKYVGNNNMADYSETLEITFNKADSSVTAPAPVENLVYNGADKALVSAGTTSGGEMQYSLDGSTWATEIPQGNSAGSYTVYYKVVGGINYNDNEGGTVQVTIAKATPTVTAPVAKNNLVYNTSALVLTDAGSTTGGTMQYSLDNISWSNDIPSGTNAGEYTVYYKVVGNSNYNDVAAQSIFVSIANADMSADITADGYNRVFDNQAHTISVDIPEGASIKYGITEGTYNLDVAPEYTNAGTSTVYYKVEKANYNEVTGSADVVINKKDITNAEITLGETLTYTGNELTRDFTVALLDGLEIDYTVSGNTGINAGNYELTISGQNNFAGTKSVNWSISKASQLAPEAPAAVNETIKAKADGKITGVTSDMEYKLEGASEYIAISETEIANLAAGTYLVRYKENENHLAGAHKRLVIADGAMITVSFNSNEGTAVDSKTSEYNQAIIAPTEPTKENFVFAGWYKDAECLDLWNFSNTLTEDITLYAKWNDKPVYSVSGKVTDGESGLGGITVTLKQGNTIIATTTTAADGSYSFITEDGLYNIVAEKEENDNSTIKTVKIEVTESANVNDVVFVATDINSELEIRPDTPQIIVGGLDEEAQTVSSSNGNVDVTVKMTVESAEDITGSDDATGQEQRQTEQKEIKKVSGNRYIQFIEINLTQSISGAESTKLEETSGLIEIIIPFEKGNKRNITVYRYHGSASEKLGEGIGNANADGEYFEVKENHIVVYAKKFSTYAIGYDLPSSGGGGSSVTHYTVKFDTDGGSSVSSTTVTKNAKVAEPKTPEKDGYTFGGWYTDKELTEKYDFDSKVTKNFTLYAKWDKHDDEQSSTDTHNCPSLAFDDLDITKWYHFDTDYVIENGIFKGTTETTFEPDSAQTRAMMVTVLYRVEGEPAVNRSIPFADVDMGAYYANAVIWGQQNGIIKGYSETEFGPDDKITREQIAAIMHRYAQYKGIDVSVGENTNILSYDDFDSISEYAIAAMQWACGSGLIKGRTESTLNPLDNATRVEIAAILHRFIEANK